MRGGQLVAAPSPPGAKSTGHATPARTARPATRTMPKRVLQPARRKTKQIKRGNPLDTEMMVGAQATLVNHWRRDTWHKMP